MTGFISKIEEVLSYYPLDEERPTFKHHGMHVYITLDLDSIIVLPDGRLIGVTEDKQTIFLSNDKTAECFSFEFYEYEENTFTCPSCQGRGFTTQYDDGSCDEEYKDNCEQPCPDCRGAGKYWKFPKQENI